ncbi:DNA gyrase/topoisomerase IV subunit A [Aureibacter tunicatorum]|uniref:Topoisomerase-4 subunit A n=1 Tax=Aureibacter tunicatorum TaxID=866807 RepID=A0AAE3XR78_9BACT|nr:DNA gyrase/topoisomerase IV subunit A [Aureibacter tunicatorum]MDR6241278.1 topoisomerase-4 subunit A [Aureibacter tunicatorum]BDD03538.1 DNA topoisomerase IV subunit A [Aureibacter tunicatorum]
MEDNNSNIDPLGQKKDDSLHDALVVSGMYQNWFLDYASYVILERAVPSIQDGFKPVQRRIMHAMKELDDGRYNKVANIIGHTMQFHPHGDAAIGDAIVHMGQKDLLIDTQGNWGDVRTGDRAAAPRYIEARLSKFALAVLFNKQTTDWQLSYDGRKNEPINLPVKFPLLLAQGVEGIAVGLSTKILPHNFIELIEASINLLKGKNVEIYPDFPTGGMADFTDYNQGKRGGKVRVRAKIEAVDKKTLAIKDIPFGTTTNSLIESIIKANDKGKIKVKKVVDNTAKDVEILVHLAPNQSPDLLIDALYAFTDCEVSISPNACVIIGEKPAFLGVDDILRTCNEQTVSLLTRELEIKRDELKEKYLFSSLEKIFIENRIYRDIEECETWEAVLQTIDKGLEPFKPEFYREINDEDIVRLTEIKIKRISKFDSFKADELMKNIEEELQETEYHLAHIVDFAIAYYQDLLKRFGKGKERKTEIRSFENIDATAVAASNVKLYVNRKEGFIGTSLKKDEFVADCSDIDDILVFRRDGRCLVTKNSDKVFVGKDIIHVEVFKRNDERKVFNLVYLDGDSGRTMIKRFQVLTVTRDREYELIKGGKKSKVLYFSANPNGEAEIIKVKLTAGCAARTKIFEYDFAELDIKGRAAAGNILTKYSLARNGITKISDGASTLGGIEVWYDSTVGRLNNDGRGKSLGKFSGDRLIAFYKDGTYELQTYEPSLRFDIETLMHLEKFDEESVFSAIYFDGAQKEYFAKRFRVETSTLNKRFKFISDHRRSELRVVSSSDAPQVEIAYTPQGTRKKQTSIYDMDLLDTVKGWKSIGNKLGIGKISMIKLLEEQNQSAGDDKEQLGLFGK